MVARLFAMSRFDCERVRMHNLTFSDRTRHPENAQLRVGDGIADSLLMTWLLLCIGAREVIDASCPGSQKWPCKGQDMLVSARKASQLSAARSGRKLRMQAYVLASQAPVAVSGL